jgi:hypothetical protein
MRVGTTSVAGMARKNGGRSNDTSDSKHRYEKTSHDCLLALFCATTLSWRRSEGKELPRYTSCYVMIPFRAPAAVDSLNRLWRHDAARRVENRASESCCGIWQPMPTRRRGYLFSCGMNVFPEGPMPVI